LSLRRDDEAAATAEPSETAEKILAGSKIAKTQPLGRKSAAPSVESRVRLVLRSFWLKLNDRDRAFPLWLIRESEVLAEQNPPVRCVQPQQQNSFRAEHHRERDRHA
jgi:hypothetical protein